MLESQTPSDGTEALLAVLGRAVSGFFLILNLERMCIELACGGITEALGLEVSTLLHEGPQRLLDHLPEDERTQIVSFCRLQLKRLESLGSEDRAEASIQLTQRLIHCNGFGKWFGIKALPISTSPEGKILRMLILFQDRTQELSEMEALSRREEAYRSMVHFSKDLTLILDAFGHLIFISPQVETMLGYRSDETLGRLVFDFIHPEDLPETRSLFAQISSSSPLDPPLICRIRRKDGTYLWIESQASDQLEHPAIRGILVAARDVSERLRDEEDLRRSQALLSHAQAVAGIGSFQVDLKTRKSTWSETNFSLWDRDPALGAPPFEEILNLVHPSDRDRLRLATMRMIQQGEPMEIEYRVPRRDGSHVHLLTKASPVSDEEGNVIRLVGASQDVTERHEHARILQEAFNRFKSLAELLPQIVFEMDLKGRLTFANRSAFEIFGASQEEFDQGLNVFDYIVPEDRLRAGAAMAKVVHGAPSGHEYTARKKTGETFPIIIYSTPILREGRPVGLRGIIVDISQQKKAEKERESFQERLRHSEKMEAIGQLAGGVAHDFNNQLSAIMGFAEMLEALAPDPTQRRFAQNIVQSCKRSSELTRQLLAFARKGQFQAVPMDIHGVLEEVVQILERSLDKRIQISLDKQAPRATALGDPGQIQNVFMNLALNARDAMPEGGQLRFRTSLLDPGHPERNKLASEPSDDFLEIQVTDTGSGMSSEIMEHLFEPFFTTKEKGKGTGLGLASAYGTIQRHQGAIHVQSHVGAGTTFRIYLPLRSQEAEPQPQSASCPVRTGHVLLVEDEPSVADMISAMLEGLGYQVSLAQDGLHAVEAIRKAGDEIDIVLLDMVMPRMGGRDAFFAMRKIQPDLKVVISSGFSVEGEARELLQSGALAFVQKPFRRTDLAAALAAALDRGEPYSESAVG